MRREYSREQMGMASPSLCANNLHQVIEVIIPDQSLTTFEYDANGNLVVMTDAAGSTVRDTYFS